MAWRGFSLRKKSSPAVQDGIQHDPAVHDGIQRELHRSFKRGDDKRIMLMNLVKEGKCSSLYGKSLIT